jgi:tetratricopeptide (TPR) repeat protein
VTEQLALDAARSRLLGRTAQTRYLGRYELRERIGQGGMGVVYRAYDPALRRTVALKLVTGSRGRRTVRRIVREAQSQARLTHPNVVEIYDVGASGTDVYITMELVDGGSLLDWLAAGPRPWREVLDVFLATGRGLVAAHEADLVHRDFKPANVLLTASGRPKIADFGLAIRSNDTTSVRASLDPGRLALSGPRLTETRGVMGTPLYMAPEQHRGEKVDAKADQFAFCVSLFEALLHAAPYPGATMEDLARQKHAGCEVPADRHGVPRGVVLAIVRGLDPQPSDRWPSMTALLGALEREARPRRRVWTAGGAIAVVALSGFALGERYRGDACATDLLGASWVEHRARIDAAYEASALPHARQSWATVRSTLDAWVESWSAAHDEVCRTDEPPEPGDPRLRCLRQRQRRFEALALVLARPGTGASEEPGLVMAGLEPPAACLEPHEDAERSDDPRWAEIDAQVAEAEALVQTPWFEDARAVASAALDAAHSAGFDDLEGRAALQLGMTYLADDDPRTARPYFEQAYFLADAGRDHSTAAVAASKVVFALAIGQGSDGDAVRWSEHAMAHLELLGEDGPVGVVELSIGLMLHRRGRYTEAAEHELRAADAFTASNDADHPLVAGALSNAGNAYVYAGEIERGLDILDRAAGIYERAYGRDSPQRASAVVNYGLGLYRAGRYTDALARFDEVLAITSGSPGEERRLTGQTLVNRALCLTGLGEHDKALATLMEARALILEALGAEHSLMATIDMNIGLIHFSASRVDEGLEFYERALATQIATLGVDHPDVAVTEHNIGVSLNSLERFREAEDHLRNSSRAFATTLGAEADYTALSTLELGRALDGLGRSEQGLELITQSLRTLESKGAQHHRFVVMASMYRGRALKNLRRLSDARAELDGALRRARGLADADPVLTTELFLERARLANAQGERAAARKELDAARKVALTSTEAKGFLPDIDAELKLARR